MQKKRYAVCGVSSRAISMYVGPMLRQFSHCAELVALLDIDPLRFQVCKDQVPEAKDVAEYLAADFDKMMAETGKNVEVIEDLVPIYNTEVSVAMYSAPKRVYLAPQMQDIPFDYTDGVLTYTVDKFSCHQMVVIDY